MSVEKRVEILRILRGGPMGVRELVGSLSRRAGDVVHSVQELEAQGLIRAERGPKGRGRPKRLMAVSELGLDYIAAYERLELRPLRGRREDLIRGAEEGLRAKRLYSRGLSPFRLMLELNDFVRDIDGHP
jgi:DNA-binding MarR family transcriptional regulator